MPKVLATTVISCERNPAKGQQHISASCVHAMHTTFLAKHAHALQFRNPVFLDKARHGINRPTEVGLVNVLYRETHVRRDSPLCTLWHREICRRQDVRPFAYLERGNVYC
jgi:hypothetical protein